MAKKLEDWELKNVFRTYLAEEILWLDVLEKIHKDYEAHMKDMGEEFDREDIESAMVEILENMIDHIEWYLDDALEVEDYE
jgi:hypothetical protein